MTPIVSIVGKSESGKTTLIEKLIPVLKERGYRVATIKHNLHGFNIDHKGKDSWRHRNAGSHITIIYSPKELALIRDMDHNASLEEIRDMFIKDADIILAEGNKFGDVAKIEIFRKEAHKEPVCMDDNNLVAFVSSEDIAGIKAPRFNLDDIIGLADLIEERFLKANPG